MIKKIMESFDHDTQSRRQAIFSSIFVEQNRIQTACEKIQTDMSMKQWLLLASMESCPEPKNLTSVGKIMGCSRQNVKQLAKALEKKGYLTLNEGPHNTVTLRETDKVPGYAEATRPKRQEMLKLLFQDFSEEEIQQLYTMVLRLYTGIERIEEYAQSLEKGAQA